jgi:hypothetical protein
MTKIRDILSGDTKEALQKKARRRRKRNRVKKDPLKEKFSPSELRDLMGVSRDRYERKSGSVRRK